MVNELNGKCEACHIDLYFLFSFIPVTFIPVTSRGRDFLYIEKWLFVTKKCRFVRFESRFVRFESAFS